MIAFNNGVANVRQTPGISADTLANRPAATVVAVGTIYITSDTNNIYRSDGENWILIGSGSGGGVNPTSQYIPYNNAGTFADSYLINNTNDFILNSFYGGVIQGFLLNFDGGEFVFGYNETTDNNNIFKSGTNCIMGDGFNNLNQTKLIINDTNQFIRTQEGNIIKGIDFRFDTEVYNFGTENYMLNVDTGNNQMQTWTNGVKYGLRITNTSTELGSYSSGGCGIGIDSTTNNITLTASSNIFMGTGNVTQFTFGANKLTFNGANLVATGVHTATANHLKVTVNGANYVIQLLTP
jgi:hypothetical protein